MSLSGITNHFINVDIMTTDYRIVGKVLVGNSGLIGLLSDTTRTFLEVRQSQVAYLHQPTRLSNQFDIAHIKRDKVFAVAAQRREDIGPLSLAHRSYTNYQRYPIHLGMGGYEIDMVMEWTGRFEISALIAENAHSFVPGYQAVIRSNDLSSLVIQSPALMVNFSLMEIIAPAVEKSTEKQ